MRFLLFIALSATALAQQSAPPLREVHLRLLAFESTSIPEKSYLFDPATTQPVPGIEAPIKGYLNHEGVTVRISGNELVFLKSVNVQDLKNPESQLAKVTLPKTGSQFMLIFLPDANQKLRVLPLDDSIKEFPLGSYRVISLSRFPVKLTLEEKAYEFKPGQSSLITDPPVQENNHSAMYAFSQVDGKWQRIGSGLWPHPGKKRGVEIFFDNPVSKQTELRGFRDISPPDPGAPPASSNAQAP